MLPNDLKPGMRFRYWPEGYRERVTVLPPRGEEAELVAYKVERVGYSWTGTIEKVIAGTTTPYTVHTSVFHDRHGNLILHPEVECDRQGFEVLDGQEG